MSRRLPHLPALDGLRAVAVILVVAYHLDLGWAAGGFIGVDVFFVISGFLITRLLIDAGGATGRVGLGEFWARRFRRLVPALVVMVAVTMLATRWWGLPEQWRAARLDGLASLAYVANWRFVLDQQSYFESALGPSPLMHTWSLAVEEQWYLLWPIVMVGLLAVGVRHRHGAAIATGTVLLTAVASAVLMAVMFDPADASRVYFGTDTRAQQLLIGAGLAWLVEWSPRLWEVADRPRLRSPFLVALGALLVVAATTPDDSVWLYRGGFLAISVLAAVVVLGTVSPRPGAVYGWLGREPWGWIGRRSYGIYLWHWPVILFVGPAMGVELTGAPLVGLQLLVIVGLAELSFRFVETPVRRSTSRPWRPVASWSAAAVAVVAASFIVLAAPADRQLTESGSILVVLDGVTQPASTMTNADQPSGSSSRSATRLAAGGPATVREPEPIGEPAPSGQPAAGPPRIRRAMLVGDSAAYSLADGYDPTIRPDWTTQGIAQVGCPLTPGTTMDGGSSTSNPVSPDCVDWRRVWAEFAVALDPDVVVVMIGAWEVLDHRVKGRDVRFPSPEWDALVGDALAHAADAAATTGARVVFLQVPCMQAGNNPGTTSRTDPMRIAAVNRLISTVAAGRSDTTVAALGDVVCPDGSDDLRVDGTPIRYDGVHYTRAGAALVWPWLFDQLDQLDQPDRVGLIGSS